MVVATAVVLIEATAVTTAFALFYNVTAQLSLFIACHVRSQATDATAAAPNAPEAPEAPAAPQQHVDFPEVTQRIMQTQHMLR